MLLVFCFPFLDLRYLVAEGTFGVPRWHWPGADDRKPVEFVGELGRVIRNIADGRPGAIDMRAAIRFHGPPAWRSVAGRQIFADNVGQMQAHIGFLTGPLDDLSELLERIGNALVEVRRSSSGPVTLTQAGLALAGRYLADTALTCDPPGGPPFPRLVREGAGSPFLVLVERPGDATAPPEASPFDGHCRLPEPAQVWAGAVGDQTSDIWMLAMRPRPAGTRMAVVRGLCRIVGWMQEVAILQRVARDPDGLALDPARVETFMRDRAGKLRRKSFEGWPVEPIVARMSQLNAANDAERDGFVEAMRRLLSAETCNDMLATLGRVDLHRDALQLASGRAAELDPATFVAAVRVIVERANRAPQRAQGEMPQVVAMLEEHADAIAQVLIPTAEVRRVVRMLIDASLADAYKSLLAGLSPAVTGELPTDGPPNERLLCILMRLNRLMPADNATPALAEVLYNAAMLMHGRDTAKEADLTAVAARAEQTAATLLHGESGSRCRPR